MSLFIIVIESSELLILLTYSMQFHLSLSHILDLAMKKRVQLLSHNNRELQLISKFFLPPKDSYQGMYL